MKRILSITLMTLLCMSAVFASYTIETDAVSSVLILKDGDSMPLANSYDYLEWNGLVISQEMDNIFVIEEDDIDILIFTKYADKDDVVAMIEKAEGEASALFFISVPMPVDTVRRYAQDASIFAISARSEDLENTLRAEGITVYAGLPGTSFTIDGNVVEVQRYSESITVIETRPKPSVRVVLTAPRIHHSFFFRGHNPSPQLQPEPHHKGPMNNPQPRR